MVAGFARRSETPAVSCSDGLRVCSARRRTKRSTNQRWRYYSIHKEDATYITTREPIREQRSATESYESVGVRRDCRSI